MKSYEEMSHDVLERIRQYKAEKKRKKAAVIRVSAITVPILIAAFAGLGLYKNGILTPQQKQQLIADSELSETDMTTSAAVATEKISPTENITENITSADTPVQQADITSSANVATEKISPTENITENTTSADTPVQHGFFQGVADNSSQPEMREMISSYPSYVEASYCTPEKGCFGTTIPLREALEEYGNEPLYRVAVQIFKDKKAVTDLQILNAEAERLFNLGYTPAVETFNDGSGPHNWLTLHAEAEQIENFAAGEDYSYFLLLYDEVIN